MMESAVPIEVLGLGRSYDRVSAIDGLSFQVRSGEIFGLLGPNGAGKTTTLKILVTLLMPTSGQALVLGHDVTQYPERVRRLIGYVPQERAIDRFLTGREHLLLLGDLYHLPKHEKLRRIDALLKLVDLQHRADELARTYSGGMKRKLDIACGLLPNPKVLFLDEPTLGLDVQSRLRIWEYIRNLRKQGITVVMTTNYLDEADQLCDRLAIIDSGRIKALGSPAELKAGLGGDTVSLALGTSFHSRLDALASALKELSCVRGVSVKPGKLEIRVESSEKTLPAVLEVANRLGYPLEAVEYRHPRLDDVFVAYAGRSIQGGFPEPASDDALNQVAPS
jgi:ABC-2 type transport system ATP-binding protein